MKATSWASTAMASGHSTTRKAASTAGSGSKTGWKAKAYSTTPATKSPTRESGRKTCYTATGYSTTRTSKCSTMTSTTAICRCWAMSG